MCAVFNYHTQLAARIYCLYIFHSYWANQEANVSEVRLCLSAMLILFQLACAPLVCLLMFPLICAIDESLGPPSVGYCDQHVADYIARASCRALCSVHGRLVQAVTVFYRG